MRLFRRKRERHEAGWLVNHDDQLYRDRGRFRVTVVGEGTRWVYRVSDRSGEIQAKESRPFESRDAALEAANDDLAQSPADDTTRPDY
jgi:hypothetical protein